MHTTAEKDHAPIEVGVLLTDGLVEEQAVQLLLESILIPMIKACSPGKRPAKTSNNKKVAGLKDEELKDKNMAKTPNLSSHTFKESA